MVGTGSTRRPRNGSTTSKEESMSPTSSILVIQPNNYGSTTTSSYHNIHDGASVQTFGYREPPAHHGRERVSFASDDFEEEKEANGCFKFKAVSSLQSCWRTCYSRVRRRRTRSNSDSISILSSNAYHRIGNSEEGNDHHDKLGQKQQQILWMTIMVMSFACERVTFKVLVDRAGPFRLLATEFVTGLHTLLLAAVVVYTSIQKKNWRHHFDVLNLNMIYLGLILLLDSFHVALHFLSGSHVQPVSTMTLTYWTIPMTLCFTYICQFINSICCRASAEEDDDDDCDHYENDDQFDASTHHSSGGIRQSFHQGPSTTTTTSGNVGDSPQEEGGGGLGGSYYSWSHLFGALLVLASGTLCLCPSMSFLFSYYHSTSPSQQGNNQDVVVSLQSAWNTVVFVGSFIPASISQLLKEQMLKDYRQPIDEYDLNFVCKAGQLILIGILSPLFYPLQGIGLSSSGKWNMESYPPKETSQNFLDGILCFVGALDTEQLALRYPERAYCGPMSIMLIVSHVVFTILTTYAVKEIVLRGVGVEILSDEVDVSSSLYSSQQGIYHSMIVGTILGSLCLWLYGQFLQQTNNYMGPDNISTLLHVSGFVLLILGLVIYYRKDLLQLQFDTVYP